MSGSDGIRAVTRTSGFSWRRVLRLFSGHRPRVALVLALVLSTSILSVVNPLLIQVVFDDALFPGGGPDLGLLWTLTGVMAGITVATTALGVWQTWTTNALGQDVLRDLRDDVYSHLHSLSLSFYATSRTGELQSRIANDVGGVQTAVTSTLSNLLSNLVTFVAALVALFVLSWQLALLAVATIPFFVVATRWVGRRRRELTGRSQAAIAEMNVLTNETLSVSGFTLARLFGRSDREIRRFETRNREVARVATRQQVIGQAFFTVVSAFLGLTPVIVYLVAGLLIDGGADLTPGTIVAFTTLQTRLFFPVARMLETFVELQSSQAMFARIFEYLDTEPDVVERPDAVTVTRHEVEGRLAFTDVSFHYATGEGQPVPALDGISFTAAPGQLVAFVGASGAGKSTILSLVPRLYDVTSGEVTIDGIDVRDLTFASLADVVGVVTQESYLFADTLRANIAYAQPDASDAEIEKAARAAAIHDRIVEFDDGYDTVVGERGFRLSGGERQRIAIARVLLHDPRILVLDEATSALDTTSERRIQAALAELLAGRTTLAVAHRLSTIRAADVIHVVEAGRIVESGSHDELVEAGGAYRRLYDEQFGGGTIETTCSDGFVMADGDWRPLTAGGERHLERRSRPPVSPTGSGRSGA